MKLGHILEEKNQKFGLLSLLLLWDFLDTSKVKKKKEEGEMSKRRSEEGKESYSLG